MISSERDSPLDVGARAGLDAHMAHCTTCRRSREILQAAAAEWRRRDASVLVPDADAMALAVRREIARGEGDGPRLEKRRSWWSVGLWMGLPALGAAALAIVLWTRGPGAGPFESDPAGWTQFVEVDAAASAPVIFVDEASGWVVVWAGEAEPGSS